MSLLSIGDGGYKLAVALDVSLPSVSDRATDAELVRAAYLVRPYSNATRGNIDVDLRLDGEAIRRLHACGTSPRRASR